MLHHDYVIVGAGSAGCALAARLSEDSDVSVLLLEAGGPDSQPEIHIPAAFGSLLKTSLDWDLVSEPEPGLDGRRNYLPRGKMLGGSSSINAMIYIRGHRADFDEWRRIAGDQRWSYEAVLPYFRRSEDNERGESAYHGVGGPLAVSESRAMTPMVDSFVEAALQHGQAANPDFNGPEQEGFGRYQLTQRGGMRCSAAAAFLHPVMARENLTVLTGALAHRVILEGGRAVGVEYEQGGVVHTVRADTEVVVSAGAYLSPQLLLLSGIGPAAELALLGIEAVVDLPVGHNLQDHLTVLFSWLTDQESLMTALTPENVALLQEEGRGPLTSNIAEGGGFFRSRDDLAAPDLQIHAGPVMFHEEGLGAPTAHAIVAGPCLLAPTSRGTVSLRSTLPIAKPRIAHGYLSTGQDRDALLAGMRTTLEIAGQPALGGVITGDHLVPRSTSDADLLDYLQRRAHTIYHPVGTCAIGAVVDSELRVMGVDGLRVVDASVMPTVPRGNTNAATIMIAERAADLIRGVPEAELPATKLAV
jgi:choline dehydrogenase